MITEKQNQDLTRTGPGTLMGDLFRRYWMPALLASELPEPDCAPVRVKLLSEPLVAFRDTKNRPQRRMRPALSLPRLEVRHYRPVRGPAVGRRRRPHEKAHETQVVSVH